jgi:AmmeMemoRadiSam system protein B
MRSEAVSGTFYPSRKEELERLVEECFAAGAGMPELGNEAGLEAVVCPHAGLAYSGAVAAYAYREIARSFASPPTFVIAGPNHTGQGLPLALSLQDWRTPLGTAENDRELGEAIARNSSLIAPDERAHEFEHSIEVQLPFLQFLYKKTRIVPICMGFQDPESARDVANAVFKAAAETRRNVLFIASSDFTHFESAEGARARDRPALAALEKLDAGGFQKARERKNASICGYGTITAAIVYARLKGCTRAKLLKYANSGDVTGDFNQVVAYASAAMRLR